MVDAEPVPVAQPRAALSASTVDAVVEPVCCPAPPCAPEDEEIEKEMEKECSAEKACPMSKKRDREDDQLADVSFELTKNPRTGDMRLYCSFEAHATEELSDSLRILLKSALAKTVALAAEEQ